MAQLVHSYASRQSCGPVAGLAKKMAKNQGHAPTPNNLQIVVVQCFQIGMSKNSVILGYNNRDIQVGTHDKIVFMLKTCNLDNNWDMADDTLRMHTNTLPICLLCMGVG